MDLSSTIEADSTQINADDLISHPITVTVKGVSAGTAEQPINIHTVETPGRAYRPSKSMRRVLVACWGADAGAYVGRRMTLYREPSITFGRDVVGGVRISALSHIPEPITVPLTVSRGKRVPFTVDPLPDAPPARDWVADIAQAATMGDLAALYGASPKTPDIVAAKDARKAELQAVDAELLPEADQ